MEIAVFQQVFNAINQMNSQMGAYTTSIANLVMPIFGSIFVAYFLMVAVNYWNGSSGEQTLLDLTKRFITWTFILGLGVNIQSYNEHVKPLILNAGNELAQSISGHSISDGNTFTAQNNLDKMLGEILNASNVLMKKGILGDTAERTDRANTATAPLDAITGQPNPNNPQTTEAQKKALWEKAIDGVKAMGEAVTEAVPAMIGQVADKVISALIFLLCWIVLVVSGMFFLAIVAADLYVAQIVLSLLSIIAPVFIAFALFPQTRQYFQAWVNSVFAYSFLILFVSILSHMALRLITEQMSAFTAKLGSIAGTIIDHATGAVVNGTIAVSNASRGNIGAINSGVTSVQDALIMGGAVMDGAGSIFSAVMVIGSMFIVFGLVAMQLPQLASSLFGGFASGGGREVFNLARGKINEARKEARKGGGSAGQA